MNVRFVRFNKKITAITIFITLMLIVHYVKPSLVYDEDQAFRKFGVGYQNKTIMPIWLVSIILAIFSYLSVVVYTS
jgi:hypothetical protein